MARTYKRKRAPRTTRRYKRKAMKKKAVVPRSMRPLRYTFKRDLEQTIQLNGSTAPDGWYNDGNYRIYTNLAWSLASLGATTDFTNLFRQYKINGARVRMYFSNTASTTTELGSNSYYTNSQILCRMATNQRGTDEVLNNSYWFQRQAKKYKTALNGGRPIDIYMPLTILSEVASSTGSSNVMRKPSYVSTANTNIVHHGLNIALERVDGQGFSQNQSNYQYCKLITTLYLEFRGVE